MFNSFRRRTNRYRGLGADAQEPLQQVSIHGPVSRGSRRDSGRGSSVDYTMRESFGWESAAPEDAFVHIFEMLGYKDLTMCARVSHAWRYVVYDSCLWRELDLSKIWFKVNDEMLIGLLASSRFSEIQVLNLHGCIAITDKSLEFIQQHCPHLETLLLTNCRGVTPLACLVVAKVLNLKRIELFGVTINWKWGLEIFKLNKNIDMGFFWKRTCAGLCVDEDTGEAVELDRCRHATAFAERACWGDMIGRNVFAGYYDTLGNFPTEVVYSCQLHEEDDFKDDSLFRCFVCQRLFREESMCSDNLICEVCYDAETLREKDSWVKLTKKNIMKFGMGNVFENALSLVDKESLPHTLVSYGKSTFHVDCSRLEENEEEEQEYKQNEVPLEVFTEINHQHVEQQLSILRNFLTEALESGKTRAILVYDDKHNLEVLADNHPIVNGRSGHRFLHLTQIAWANGKRIIWPYIGVLLTIAGFLYIPGISTSYATYAYAAQLQSSQDQTNSVQYILIMLGVFIFTLLVTFCLFVRFRQQCIKFLKIFIFADLLVLFLIGVGVLLFFLTTILSLPLDYASFSIVVWNSAASGMFALYNDVNPSMHRISMACLFAVMGVMMVATLSTYIVLLLAGLFAACDIVSAIRPNFQVFQNFIVFPTPPHPQFHNPRIYYPVDGAVVRPIDLLWFGLALKLVNTDLVTLTTTVMSLLACLVITVFVTPYLGYSSSVRPVPFAVIVIVVCALLVPSTIGPMLDQLYIPSTTSYSFGKPVAPLY